MKIDCHMHVNGKTRQWGWESNDKIIEAADKLGIDKLCCSIPITSGMPSHKEAQACNEDVLAAMNRYPDRILGCCFVNPVHQKKSLEEIEHCILEHGMMGIKLYNQFKCSDPIVYPVVEKAIELGVPILEHAGYVTDPEQASKQPNLSNAQDFVTLAAEYPEAMLIEAHLGGGGDWEWAIKALRHSQSVYLDTSGSVIDEGMIEMAVRELGAERLLFGTDMTMEGGVGKILGADITAEQREMIFWKNMHEILERRK
jgi:predicted TIM-barrel fold metal-dependent hydrolase